MRLSQTIIMAAAALATSVTAYYDGGSSYLTARGFDDFDLYERDFDDYDLFARDADLELVHDLATRDVDELADLFTRALEIRGTAKRPNLGGNLKLSPQDMHRANQQIPQQVSMHSSAPPLPKNHGGSYFPPQKSPSRKGSSDSMRSLFGSP